MTDLEQLIAAWIRWEGAPSSPAAADCKEDALAALALSGLRVHTIIAAHRRAGCSIPDAVQAALQEAAARARAERHLRVTHGQAYPACHDTGWRLDPDSNAATVPCPHQTAQEAR